MQLPLTAMQLPLQASRSS